MKKGLMFCLVLIMTVFVTGCRSNTIKPAEIGQALQFTNREELSEYIKNNEFENYRYNIVAEDVNTSQATGIDGSATKVEDDYTKTNVQVEGVDEGDIVKVDGSAIYQLTFEGFVIIQVNSGQMEIASRVEIENYVPIELYCYKNKLVTIGRTYEKYQYTGVDYYVPGYDYCYYVISEYVDIRVYDISDLTNPKLDYQVSYRGNLNTTRLVDGKLIYIGNYYNYNGIEEFIPKYWDSSFGTKEYREFAIQDIYYFERFFNRNYMIVGSIDLDHPEQHDIHAFLGIDGIVYASSENLYVSFMDWQFYYSDEFREIPDSEKQIYSNIVRISFDNLLCVAQGTVLGYLDDQYHMDEYDGYLRLATTSAKFQMVERPWGTTWTSVPTNNIIIVDMNLKEVGKITGIAEGEQIYSIRFNKEKGALVTFEQIDPLFNLDLSDPTNPKISKGLKEEGVSYYLHYIEGTDYIIGLGYDTESNGNFVTQKGIKVSLYDMSSGEAVNVSTINLSEYYSYTEAVYNPNAILYDKDLNIFAFAASIYDYNKYSYKEMRQGLIVFGFDNGKLTERAFLTDQTTADYTNQDNYFLNNYNSVIKRGVRIGEYVYTISTNYVTSYKLDEFTLTQRLAIN